jgi:hypothetical protein
MAGSFGCNTMLECKAGIHAWNMWLEYVAGLHC